MSNQRALVTEQRLEREGDADSSPPRPSDFVRGEAGQRLQRRAWHELMLMLEKVETGISTGVTD
jgi:hypothetical protein